MSKNNRTYSRGWFVKTLGVAAIAGFFTSKLLPSKQSSQKPAINVVPDKRALSREDFI